VTFKAYRAVSAGFGIPVGRKGDRGIGGTCARPRVKGLELVQMCASQLDDLQPHASIFHSKRKNSTGRFRRLNVRLDVVGRPPSNCWAGRVREVDVLHSKNTRTPRGIPAETEPMRTRRPRQEKSQREAYAMLACRKQPNPEGCVDCVNALAYTLQGLEVCNGLRSGVVSCPQERATVREISLSLRGKGSPRELAAASSRRKLTRRAFSTICCHPPAPSCTLLRAAVSNPGRLERSVVSFPPLPRSSRTLASPSWRGKCATHLKHCFYFRL
jgi:hypothetical protein